MTHGEYDGGSRPPVHLAIFGIIVLYALALLAGGPQWGTRQIVASQAAHGGAVDADAAAVNSNDPPDTHAAGPSPPFWTVVPFVLLLGGIAVLPLIPATAHWWESNLHRFYVAIGLSILVLAYYAVVRGAPVEGHWPIHHVVDGN